MEAVQGYLIMLKMTTLLTDLLEWVENNDTAFHTFNKFPDMSIHLD